MPLVKVLTPFSAVLWLRVEVRQAGVSRLSLPLPLTRIRGATPAERRQPYIPSRPGEMSSNPLKRMIPGVHVVCFTYIVKVRVVRTY